MNDKTMIAAALVVIVAVGGILYGISGKTTSPTGTTSTTSGTGSGEHLALAQCLKNSGVVFYGAFWCPHCKTQKADFGDAVPALPYIECSTADGNSQTAICQQKGIQNYPTWIFADGTRLTGEQSLQTLATKASCPFAGASSTPSVTATGTPAS